MTRRRGLERTEMVGLIAALVLGVVTVLVFGRVINKLFASSSTTVTAQFADTELLSKGDPVRVDGVDVGEVKSLALNAGGASTTVGMTVSADALPLYGNATATIKWRTALGGSYSIAIDRGSPSAGKLTDLTIPESRTENQVEVDQLLTAFGAQERAGLQTMLRELPQALANPMQPGRLLSTLAKVAPTATVGLAAVRGTNAGDLRALVANTASTVAGLDTSNQAIHGVVQGAAATFQTTAAHQLDIRKTIVRAAAVMPNATTTLAQLQTTLGLADPLIAKLNGPAVDVAPTARTLRPVLVGASSLLHNAVPLLHALRPAATSLDVVARQATPLLQQLTPTFDGLANLVLPRLATVDPGTKHPAYEMIGPAILDLGAAADQFDSESHVLVFPVSADANPIDDIPCKVYLTGPKLIACESLLQAFGGLLGGAPVP